MPDKKLVDLPMRLRGEGDDPRLMFIVDSLNEEMRTVDVVWTTGAAVFMRNYRPDGGSGPWFEELEVSTSALDLFRLNNRASVLKNHRAEQLTDQLGVVVPGSVRIEDGKGIATVLISERDDVKPHWGDIKAGILNKISVGYTVHQYTKTGERDGVPVFLATRWEPKELSFVPIPADDRAQTRSAQEQLSPCEIISSETKGADMPDKNKPIPGQDPAPVEPQTRNSPAPAPAAVVEPTNPSPALDEAAIAKRAVEAERARGASIIQLCTRAGVPREQADELISRGVSVEEAPARILDILAERSGKTQINSQRVEMGFDHDDPKVKRERMSCISLRRGSCPACQPT